MRTQALRIVSSVAMGAAIFLTLTPATKLSPQAAELMSMAAPASSLTQTQTSARATSYRPDAPDTGPPSPGPTDPNGPSS
jgi:hypothetical protein